VLAAWCLMYFLFYMDRVNISSLAPVIGKELQLNAFQFGIVFSAFALSLRHFQIIGGCVGDRLGPEDDARALRPGCCRRLISFGFAPRLR